MDCQLVVLLSSFQGEWKYEDGSPLTYVNWRNGEPNNVNDEDCAVMGYNGLYHDVRCSKTFIFVCEYYVDIY